jgi:hypothetical protein
MTTRSLLTRLRPTTATIAADAANVDDNEATSGGRRLPLVNVTDNEAGVDNDEVASGVDNDEGARKRLQLFVSQAYKKNPRRRNICTTVACNIQRSNEALSATRTPLYKMA